MTGRQLYDLVAEKLGRFVEDGCYKCDGRGKIRSASPSTSNSTSINDEELCGGDFPRYGFRIRSVDREGQKVSKRSGRALGKKKKRRKEKTPKPDPLTNPTPPTNKPGLLH